MFTLLRLALFIFAGSIGVVNIFNLTKLSNHSYITPRGIETVDDFPTFFVFVEHIMVVMRTMFGFVVMVRLIQTPNESTSKEQRGIDNGIIWTTFMAVLLMALGSNTDHTLVFELWQGSSENVESTHFAFNFADPTKHSFTRVFLAVSKSVCISWGFFQVMLNLSRLGTFTFDQTLKWHKILVGSVDCSVFLVGMGYTIYNIVVKHPWSIPHSNQTVVRFLETTDGEYYLYQSTELALSLVGFLLTFYANFMYNAKKNEKTVVALSWGFRNAVIGLYTSTSATWYAFTTDMYDHDPRYTFYTLFPLLYFFGVAVLTGIYSLVISNTVTLLRDGIQITGIIGERLFHNSGAVVFWRIGHSLCIFALLHLLLIGNMEWFHVDVSAGTAVRSVENIVDTIEREIISDAEKAFSHLKSLDPCRWSIKNNDPSRQLINDIHYSSEYGGRTKTTSFKLDEHDFTEMGCGCKAGQQCDCDLIHSIKQNVTAVRQQKENFIQNSAIGEIDGMVSIENYTDNSKYAEALEKCHSIECDVVLATAVGAEAVVLGSNLFSFFGPLATEADTGAWLLQMGNRIGHGVVTMATKLAKVLKGLFNRVLKMRPLFRTVKFLSTLLTVVHFSPTASEILIVAPIFIQGLFSVAVGLVKRKNINTAATEVNLVTKVYIPLTLASWFMAILLFSFPPIVRKVLQEIPSFLLTTKFKETHSLTVIRYIFIVNSLGASSVTLSSIITAFEKLKLSGNRFIRLIREPITQGYRQVLGKPQSGDYVGARRVLTRANTDSDRVGLEKIFNYVDQAWFEAFLLSLPVFVLLYYSIVNEYDLFNYYFGPTERFLKFIAALRPHATVHAHASEGGDTIREGLCGLVGKGIKAAANAVISELETIFKAIEHKLASFLDAIDDFVGLTNVFDKLGRVVLAVFSDTWRIVEYILTLGIPVMNTVLFATVAVIKSYYVRQGRESDAKEIENYFATIIEMLVYYNVVLILLLQQLFNVLGNGDFEIIHFGLNHGKLLVVGAGALLLNGLSIASIFVSQLYPLS